MSSGGPALWGSAERLVIAGSADVRGADCEVVIREHRGARECGQLLNAAVQGLVFGGSGVGMSQIEVVRFHGDNLQAVRDDDRVWVVVKRVCESLGIAEQRQAEKLKDKPWAVTTFMVATGADGKSYEMFCLDLDCVPMWLATIDPSRVNAEARPKLIGYQHECARVLRDHFFGRMHQQDLVPLLERAAQMAAAKTWEHLASVLLPRITGLEQRVGWIERVLPTAVQGQISACGLSCLRAFVRRIAEYEVALGRWRSMRAARAGIYRALSEHVSWGGAAKSWEFLPLHLEQVALAFLRERLRTAQRLLGERHQLALAGPEDDDEGDDGSGQPH